MPKYTVSQPAIALCIESRSSKSPTTTSAPFSRNAWARSSSVRTIPRTAWPCVNASSVTCAPTAQTRPAAPVTRMGLAMIFTPVRSVNQAPDLWNVVHRHQSSPHSRTLNDAEIALGAGAECLQRLLVRITFVSRQRDVVAVEFDNDG